MRSGRSVSGRAGRRRLEEAVAAYRAALKERTVEAAPHYHDIAQGNLARAQALLDARRKGAGE